jgi:hypothetical protein
VACADAPTLKKCSRRRQNAPNDACLMTASMIACRLSTS